MAGAVQTQVTAGLKALTLTAQNALHGQTVVMDVYPFRVGRENRGPNAGWVNKNDQDRRGNESPNNDLYLWDPKKQLHVSRDHFQIECDDEGQFFLVDRNSALGTWVEGQLIGGNRRGGRVHLCDGDVIIVGAAESGYVFKFYIDDQA